MKKQRNKKQAKKFRISAYARQMLEYWDRSLLKGAEIEGLMDRGRDSWLSLKSAELHSARVMKDVYDTFFSRVRSDDVRQRVPHHPGQDGALEIVISLRRIYESYGKSTGTPHDLIIVPAQLSRSGELLAPDTALPWIPREYLEPVSSDRYPTIGLLSRSEKFFHKNTRNSFRSFEDYIEYCDSYFRYVSGEAREDFTIEGYRSSSSVYLRTYESSTSSIKWLLRILEESLKGRRNPGLLEKFCRKAVPKRRLYTMSRSGLYAASRKHLGHTTTRYPLAPSQRQAVHRFLETPEGEVFCVNGPPGTGKTTVLQSFIASMWVASVLRKDPTPPVSLVCGATNQSVLNVLHAFEHLAEPTDSFSMRWLPKVVSYGSFLSSFGKFDEAEGYQMECADGRGFSAEMEHLDYVQEAERYYLARYQEHFPRPRNMLAAAAFLRKEVTKIADNLSKAVVSTISVSLRDIVFGNLVRLNEDEYRKYLEDLSSLDTGIRYRCFLYATHYWEARWLLEARSELMKRRARKDADQRFRSGLHDWRRRAMITPVFVSTISMAGRFFAIRDLREHAPLDILYFDEGGQVSPEFGAPLSALAKKVVVIGDSAQLAPYTNIPAHIDETMLLDASLISGRDESEFGRLIRLGKSVSSSNMMELAVASCEREDGRSVGASLEEHRRSVPEIVSFCNQLSYHGRLIPMRKPLSGRMIPTFSFFAVEGTAVKVGQSRRNSNEAKQIRDFLASMASRFSDYYKGKALHEILAVLTPFTAQARELERLLKPDYPEMIIGTVHSLQGAERDIILFSSVYDDAYQGSYVFDMDKRILNVAVSRARDSFIVFGSPKTFARTGQEQAPRFLLGDYLFRDRRD
jgi:hypothetical protein